MGSKRFRNRDAGELAKLKKQVRASFGASGHNLAFQETQGEKMSDVLDEFLAPYKSYAKTTEQYRVLIALGIIAWNASLVQGKEREKQLDQILGELTLKDGEKTRQDFRHSINEMIERKEKFFANNRRYIVDYQLTETPTGLHLSVASTLK